jgi:hypothetical protein
MTVAPIYTCLAKLIDSKWMPRLRNYLFRPATSNSVPSHTTPPGHSLIAQKSSEKMQIVEKNNPPDFIYSLSISAQSCYLKKSHL